MFGRSFEYSNKELAEYGKIAREKIINNYSIEFVKNQYISLYKSSIRKNN